MMIEKIVIILITTTLVLGRIKTNIHIADQKHTSVKCFGSDEKLISDEDLRLFNVTDDNVKEGARKVLNSLPKDVFLKSPTPWKDLYKRYHWKEVSRKLHVESCTILKYNTKTVEILTHNYVNNSSRPYYVDTGLIQRMENVVKTTWLHGNKAFKDVPLNVNITIDNDSKDYGVAYETNWGNNVDKVKSVVLGSPVGLQVKVRPEQTVTAKLTAKKVIITARIDYNAMLDGRVAVNYSRKIRGHYFWSLDFIEVAMEAGMTPLIRNSEFVDITLYFAPSLVVYDSKLTDESTVC